MARILIVDDEAGLRRMLTTILEGEGHDVCAVDGVVSARRELSGGIFDAVVTDQRMPDGDGLTLIGICRETDAALPVILITAYATVELAVEAMRQGAFDVVPKPFEPEQVRAVVARACRQTELLRENERLRGQVRRAEPAGPLLGRSAAIGRVRELVARVAATDATVLITGETGTGKELVAHAIHAKSGRANGPFVAVNCAAFSESLLESELFGHEKGAFTGADRPRAGVFEAAHHGTLFLDEAGEMPLSLQAKLLRVLMNGEVVRVGSVTPRRVDVRILVATNRDLSERVRQGLFREDLYYRLAVFPIAVPPLRERREDIPMLVAELMRRSAADLKVPLRRLTPEAEQRLDRYDYPGNVRELRNILERAMILARADVIGVEDIPAPAPPLPRAGGDGGSDAELAAFLEGRLESIDLRAALTRVEREAALAALSRAGGVQAEAARRLGLSRSDFAYKLRRLAISHEKV